MIESILLEEEHQERRPKGAQRYQWVIWLTFSLFLAGAAVGLVMFFDAKTSDSGSSSTPPILTSPNSHSMCDACTLIPRMEEHVMCNSCEFSKEDSKSLLCPSGYGDLAVHEVEFADDHHRHSHDASCVVAIQKECSEQYGNYLEDSGEPFACTFTLSNLLPAETLPKSRAKVKYICRENVEVETFSETESYPSFRLQAPAPVVTEPFLSSVLVKCEKKKILADTVEVGKSCAVSASGPITLSCTSGSDPRVIIQKISEDGVTGPQKGKNRINKKRAQMFTNFCAADNMIDGQCTISPDDLLMDSETDISDKSFEIKYLCSYGNNINTDSALILQNALESGSGGAGEPLLSSALVKCGNRKEYASTVEVAKVCSDQDFELQCNPENNPRMIVLAMWDGNRSEKHSKIAKQRAKAATNLCSTLENGVCTFSMSDLSDTTTEAPAEPDVLSDVSISVKYLCSYDAPLVSFEL